MSLFKLFIVSVGAVSICFLSSCGCCTGEDPAPKLRPLPKFNDLPTVDVAAPAPAPVPIVEQSAK